VNTADESYHWSEGRSSSGARASALCLADIDLQLISIPAEPSRWPDCLSATERAVARHLIHGDSYCAIAAAREISEDTVSAHVSAVMKKLNVRSAAQIVAILARSRLL